MNPVLLIAEQDADLRDAYGRLGSARGLQAVMAADGLECVRKFSTLTPDALLVDLEILWGGGDGVLACMREGVGPTDGQAVFVTGFDSPQVLSRRSGVPSGNCFQKPFRVSRLLDSICAMLACRDNPSAEQTTGV